MAYVLRNDQFNKVINAYVINKTNTVYGLRYRLNPRTYKGVGGGGGKGWLLPTHKVFLSFFLEDKTSAPDVFSSCSFIPRANFEVSLVMVSCYGNEI